MHMLLWILVLLLPRLQSLGGSLVPTLGGLIRIPGASLGGATLTSNILALFDNGAAGAPLTVVNFTESALIVSIPPGDGANHTLQVRTLRICVFSETLHYALSRLRAASCWPACGLSWPGPALQRHVHQLRAS